MENNLKNIKDVRLWHLANIQNNVHYILDVTPSKIFEYNTKHAIQNYNVNELLSEKDTQYFKAIDYNPKLLFWIIPDICRRNPAIYLITTLWECFIIDSEMDVMYHRPKYLKNIAKKFYEEISQELHIRFKNIK